MPRVLTLRGLRPLLLISVWLVTLSPAMAQPLAWSLRLSVDAADAVDAEETGADAGLSALSAAGVRAQRRGTTLELAGTQSLEALRQTLFDTARPQLDLLGGPLALELSVPTDLGRLRLALQARLTTGYRWEVVSGDGERSASANPSRFTMLHDGPGAPAIQEIALDSIPADGRVRLLYRRPFEPDLPLRGELRIRLPSGVEDLELTDPTPTEPRADRDQQTDQSADPFASLPTRALPSRYDAREAGIVTPVRDQGSCGSCWSFGTVSVMEIAVAKATAGTMQDLSEQFLISCNLDDWGCDGGLTATKYHVDVLARSQSAPGAVREADAPYTATDGSCARDFSNRLQGADWEFISGSEWIVPPTDQIKNAILTYGAITAGVCVDDGWYSYQGGVYESSSNICDGTTNHQIALVGWDDATQSWILRNSWGPNWGENGYMRITYDPNGTGSRVGEGASWVVYQAGSSTTKPGAATPGAPQGTTQETRPTYSWRPAATATDYQLLVKDARQKPVFQRWYGATAAGCAEGTGSCAIKPDRALANGDYQWWVQTYNDAGYGPWSQATDFRIAAAKPGAATLVAPTGRLTDASPDFVWQPVSAATYYQLWVQTASGIKSFSDWYPAAELGCADGSSQCRTPSPAALPADSYQWWIQTWNPAGYGPWSRGTQFTVTVGTVPTAVRLVAPQGAIADPTPTYRWQPAAGATYYQLWVETAAGVKIATQWYSASQAGCANGQSTCERTADQALEAGGYRWWIQTWNPAGYGGWSRPGDFVLDD